MPTLLLSVPVNSAPLGTCDRVTCTVLVSLRLASVVRSALEVHPPTLSRWTRFVLVCGRAIPLCVHTPQSLCPSADSEGLRAPVPSGNCRVWDPSPLPSLCCHHALCPLGSCPRVPPPHPKPGCQTAVVSSPSLSPVNLEQGHTTNAPFPSQRLCCQQPQGS